MLGAVCMHDSARVPWRELPRSVRAEAKIRPTAPRRTSDRPTLTTSDVTKSTPHIPNSCDGTASYISHLPETTSPPLAVSVLISRSVQHAAGYPIFFPQYSTVSCLLFSTHPTSHHVRSHSSRHYARHRRRRVRQARLPARQTHHHANSNHRLTQRRPHTRTQRRPQSHRSSAGDW